MREAIADAILIATGVIFLFLFWEFLVYGKVYVWEPNEFIAGAELVLSIFIIIFGIERLYKDYFKG